ncbi:MAG: ABC transporter permease [Caldilineaceae bacterium]
MIKIVRYLGVAFESIFSNKLRAALTMLGIIIGVAAVLSTMGIGAGASASITSSIQSQGTNLLEISSTGNTQTLTVNDADVLADPTLHPDFGAVLTLIRTNLTMVVNDNSSSGQVQGVQPIYATVRNLTVENGRFFNDEEMTQQSPVVVLGATLASDLFGTADPLGQDVRIGGDVFSVVGVLKKSGGNSFFSNDQAAFVPFTVAQRRLVTPTYYRGQPTVSSITVQVKDGASMDKAQTAIEMQLRLLHGLRSEDKNDFSIFNQASLLDALGSVTQVLTIFLGSIGGISLLVGGIGIMNIMLVSVTERTKEIGLRKALGAHDSDILLQFLVEALVLCLLGGLIGVSLSYGIAYLVSLIPAVEFEVIITSSALLLALGVCSASAFVFGLYPALRATRLDPIEALRYE